MKIDLHIHTRTGSDGAMTLEEVFAEAKKRGIGFMSVTDHDAIAHQGKAVELAALENIRYVTGVELNVTVTLDNKSVALDFLGYGYNFKNTALNEKLQAIRDHREKRSRKIIDNLNAEFTKENRPLFNDEDLRKMQEGVDGILSRPHIADYLIKKGVVVTRQEAFEQYLVKCDVPKYPLPPEEAASLIKNAGGRLVLAHPNDPNGTSLISVSKNLDEQTKIIDDNFLKYIDGIECWHARADAATSKHYADFCKKRRLMMTGGSDCHQKPVLIGTVSIPTFVPRQFH
jgi:3',5'-nucleoside bisphosphate phosphatase